jgi:hypothetical protein
MRRPRALCAAELYATQIGTLLTQRERGCCERETLRGPFVFKAHPLVLAGEPLTRLYVLSASAKATPALAVVAILSRWSLQSWI